ncbi:MAG: hypothetical protein Ct9H300mP29_0980 [Candidatus Neomarinimicrobiota bacterium]|nr:MAG: hypothetical protein Ct9H300mP29_0980 [Candidatus Neomarinimicrobiota bacterium]
MAVLNEALIIKYNQTGNPKNKHFKGDEFQLRWEDLLMLRKNGGLPGMQKWKEKHFFSNLIQVLVDTDHLRCW